MDELKSLLGLCEGADMVDIISEVEDVLEKLRESHSRNNLLKREIKTWKEALAVVSKEK